MQKIFFLILLFLLSLNIQAKEVYICNRICGYCEDNSCCRNWSGYIESTDNINIYTWKSNEREDDFYLFYKTNDNNINKESYEDAYITNFKNVEEQQILIIDRKNKTASFNDGPDEVVECNLMVK